MSTAARHYGLEWSSTTILEIVAMQKTKTVKISERVSSLKDKSSYRSETLSQFYNSLDVNIIYIHKGDQKNFESVKIDDVLGPISSKEQLLEDVKFYRSKVRDQRLKRIYDRILEEF